MTIREENRWLEWAREIEALAQAGYSYASNPYERERSIRLREIAAEIIAGYSQLSEQDVLDAFMSQPGYVTPKVDVRAAVFQDDQLLFVKEAMDGRWTFPGGWADVGELPSTAIEREVAEEAGLQVKAERLIGVYDANRYPGKLPLFHAYKLLFLCTPLSGTLKPNFETLEAAFFQLNQIPKSLSRFRTTKQHLEDAIEAYRDPSRPTIFD
jgi:ADP-ribose pyrophosphatase YjhB (NUDIX family)